MCILPHTPTKLVSPDGFLYPRHYQSLVVFYDVTCCTPQVSFEAGPFMITISWMRK